jgi:uncharacterized protein YjbJ (UPF0337 family)
MEKKEVNGKIKQAKGKAEEGIGKLKGDKPMEIKGKTDQITGRAQEKIGKAQGEAIKAAKKVK